MQPNTSGQAVVSDAFEKLRKLMKTPQYWLLLGSLSVFLVATWIMSRQPVRLDVTAAPALLSAEWWLTPREQNATSRLTDVHGRLQAVAASPDGATVAAVGADGLFVFSTDGGATWERAKLPTELPVAKAQLQDAIDLQREIDSVPKPADPEPAAKSGEAAALRPDPDFNLQSTERLHYVSTEGRDAVLAYQAPPADNAPAPSGTKPELQFDELVFTLNGIAFADATRGWIVGDAHSNTGYSGLGTIEIVSVGVVFAFSIEDDTVTFTESEVNMTAVNRQLTSAVPSSLQDVAVDREFGSVWCVGVAGTDEGRKGMVLRRGDQEWDVDIEWSMNVAGNPPEVAYGFYEFETYLMAVSLADSPVIGGLPSRIVTDAKSIHELPQSAYWSGSFRFDEPSGDVSALYSYRAPDGSALAAEPLQFGKAMPTCYTLDLCHLPNGRVYGVGQDGWRAVVDSTDPSEQAVPAEYNAPLPNGVIYRQESQRPQLVEWVGPANVPALVGIAFWSESSGVAVGLSGAVLTSRNADAVSGVEWSEVSRFRDIRNGTTDPGDSADLYSVAAVDNKRAWIVGDRGMIFATVDAGMNWYPQTRRAAEYFSRTMGQSAEAGTYDRDPAPWYWVVVSFCAIGVAFSFRRRAASPSLDPQIQPAVKEASIADKLVSDRPLQAGERDALDFTPVADGLSRFLRNESTTPPLTLSIEGPWGSGKSSLMNLLRASLASHGMRPVWFNAWHHQKEEHLLAALLQSIRRDAVPSAMTFSGFLVRLGLLRRRWRQPRIWVSALVTAVLGYLVTNGLIEKSVLENASDASEGFANAASSLLAVVLRSSPLVTVIPALQSVFTAFLSKPASLMSSRSGGTTLRDLDAQTSFRHRFASEFREVTDALGARRIVIFIDDLDRCQPQNVMDMLEAVNFLVSSGDCYVVMAIDMERVRRYVAQHFEKAFVTESETGDASTASTPPLTPEQERQRQLIRFADHYLEKLINIRVPVPQATQGQAERLLVGDNVERAAPRESRRFPLRSALYWAPAALDRMFGIPLVVAGVFCLVVGWRSIVPGTITSGEKEDEPDDDAVAIAALSDQVAKLAERVEASLAPPAPPDSNLTDDSTENPNAATSENQDASASEIAIAPPPELPDVHPGAGLHAPDSNSAMIAALATLIVFGVFWTVQTVFADPQIRDSEEFVGAVRLWMPLLEKQCDSNPRALKRYLNRVRYLSMRLRPWFGDDMTAWEAFVNKLFGHSTDRGPQGKSPIPDGALVGLSALELRNAKWVGDQNALLADANAGGPAGDPVLSRPESAELLKAIPSLVASLEWYQFAAGLVVQD